MAPLLSSMALAAWIAFANTATPDHHRRRPCPWNRGSQADQFAQQHGLSAGCHNPGANNASHHDSDYEPRPPNTDRSDVIALLIRTHRPTTGQLDRAVAFAQSCAAASAMGGARILVWLSIDVTGEKRSPNATVVEFTRRMAASSTNAAKLMADGWLVLHTYAAVSFSWMSAVTYLLSSLFHARALSLSSSNICRCPLLPTHPSMSRCVQQCLSLDVARLLSLPGHSLPLGTPPKT